MEAVSKKYSVRDIVDDLTNHIVRNELSPGTLLTPPNKLAVRYQVSPQTINRAVNRLTERGILYRERGRGTFVAKRPAADGYRVGLYFWNTSSEIGLDTFMGRLQHCLQENGFRVNTTFQIPYMKYFDGEYLEKFDVLIIPEGMCNPNTAPLLRQLKIPVITICGESVSEYPFHQVCFDYRPGFFKALEYLERINQHKINVLLPNQETSWIRRDVLVECARKMGFACRVFEAKEKGGSHLHTRQGREMAREYWQSCRDGVFFSVCEFLTFGFIDYMNEQNLIAGKDYKIVSYDNLESRGFQPYGEPIITAITHPQEEMAEETVRLALDVIKNPASSRHAYKIVKVMAHEFTIRKTV